MKWKTLSGQSIPDIVQFAREATAQGQVLHIGSDSLQCGKYTQVVTVVVVLNPPKGGRVAYCRQILPRIISLRQRLLKEVWASVEIAMQISPEIRGDMTVHVDASPEEKNMSNRYVEELVGLIVGQGFKALIKPESWAASHVSDHIVRSHGRLPNSMKRRRAS